MTSRLVCCIPLLALSFGCTNQSTPTSTHSATSLAQSAQVPGGGDVRTVVTAHVETDHWVDGSIDVRQTATTSYDQSGNILSHVVESLANGEVDLYTWTFTYNKWGNVLSELFESSSNGSINGRSLLRTIDVDQRGNPTTQWYEDDFGADGNPDVLVSVAFTSYDHRSRPLEKVQDGDFRPPYGVVDGRMTQTMSYDAKGNLTYLQSESDNDLDGTPDHISATTLTYNAHGTLIEQTNEVDTGTQIFRYGLTTLEFDAQGNPIQQVITGAGGAGSRTTISTEFEHHRPISQVVEVDDGDGTIDSRATITYEYVGNGPTPNFSPRSLASSGGSVRTDVIGYDGANVLPAKLPKR